MNNIMIEVAQFESRAVGRRQLRQDQSLAARKLLGEALQKAYGRNESAQWSLEKSPEGKPFLRGDNAPSVSITHSGDWVACAIAASSAVGVDIEVIKPRDWEAYRQDVFHPLEIPWVMGGAGEERNIRGLTCWCLKEAVVKAMGGGVVFSLSEIGFCSQGILTVLPETLGSPADWLTRSQVVQGSNIQDKAVVAVVWKC